MKKATGRKKSSTKRKSADRRTGASGETPAAATGSKRLAALPIDPPPVTFPDAVATADDPRSLSWMAQQAVSALNAVKAHQAEKGKRIRARVAKEKDRPERERASSGEQTSKTAQTNGAGPGERASRKAVPAVVGGTGAEPVSVPVDAGKGEPGEAGQLQGQVIGKSAIGSSGKAGTQQNAEKQPAPSSVANNPAPKAASVPGIAAGSPLRTTTKRRYPTRLQAGIAVAIVVPVWLYFGTGDEARHVTTQPEQEIASLPMLEPVDQPESGSDDKPGWRPATAPAQFPEPLPVSRLQSTDPAKPVVAGEFNGETAQEKEQAVAGAVVTPAHGFADSLPAQPVTPSGFRAPGYGYYPLRPTWQPPPYYRPGYSRPPSR